MTSQPLTLPFPPAEFDARAARLRERMAALGLDALVTFAQENQYWLCGYETTGFHSFPQGLIVRASGERLLVTRQLEVENATDNAHALPVIGYQDDEDPGVAVGRALVDLGLSRARIGLEKRSPWATIAVFEAIRSAVPEAELVDCSGTIELLRSRKTPAEIACMREAARITGVAMQAGMQVVRAGATEFEVAAEVSRARIAAGANFTRNPTYITSGPRSALGHATWTGRVIEPGDVVFFELGANVRHYDAALIRTAVAGKAPDQLRRQHDASVAALAVAVAALKPGVVAGDVHRAAHAELARHGCGELFDHRIGYGIGIEFLTWIERGGLSLDGGSTQVLEPGMTCHVIPYFKVRGRYSVGVSATVLLTATGAERLESDCPLQLFERG